MSAAQPLAFLLAALAIPVVVAYLHRRKRVRTTVPSAILFRAIAGQATPRRRSLAHPRHLLSLLLVVLALLAGVHAVADVRGHAEQPRDVVVVLDTSTSMATESSNGHTRLELAIAGLADLLAGLDVDDRVALVTTGAEVRVRTGLTREHDRLLEVARAQRTEWCGLGQEAPSCAAQAEAALRIADAMCRQSRAGAIVLLSDGVGVSVPPTHCPIHHTGVGQPGPNLGITGLSVREADTLGLTEVYLQLTNTGPAREVEVELRVDDLVVDVVPLDVEADGQIEHLRRLELPPGAIVTARLRRLDEDVLPADDIAETPRRAGRHIAVLLVAETARSFTAEALELHPRVDLTIIGPHDRPPGDPQDLLVLETTYLAGPLPPSNHVVALGTPPAELGLPERGRFAAPELVRWSGDHPLLRFVDLEGLALPRARTLERRDTEQPLVETDEGILMALARWNDRDVLYLGFSPAESDIVLRVGFVNLVANIVEWATPRLDSSEAPPLAPALPALESRVDPPDRLEGTLEDGLTRRISGGPTHPRSAVSSW
jgi:hypothetical protein